MRDDTNSPLAPTVSTSFAISTTATPPASVSESPTSGAGYSSFTLPSGLRNKKLKVEFFMTVPATTDGVWRLSLYDSTGTRVALSTDSSSATTLPGGVTGKFVAYFDATSSTTYSLRFTQTTKNNANTLFVTNVIVGPGIQPQGAVVGEWQDYSPTTQGLGTPTFTYARWSRAGTNILLDIRLVAGTVTAAEMRVNLPNSLTIFGSSSLSASRGRWEKDNATLNTGKAGNVVSAGGNSYVTFGIEDYANNANPFSSQLANAILSNGQVLSFTATVPIAEWAGSGTVQLAQNDVEYAWNSDVTNTASVTTSGFGYGPSGVAISSNWSTNTQFVRRVRFQTPIQATDKIVLELNYSGRGWVPFEQFYPRLRQLNNFYGTELQPVSGTTTDVDVSFNIGGYEAAGATYGANGTTWSNISTSSWRVRKSSAGAAVGFGRASSSTGFGLVAPRNGQYNLTLSSPLGGFAATRAVGIYYQDQDGNHRLKINIAATFNSTTVTATQFSLTGVTFKNVAGYYQPVANILLGASTSPVKCYADPNSSNILISAASITATGICVTGDLELDSKPTWAY